MSWEERMSARAQIRRQAQDVQNEAERQRWNVHRDHHAHLRGTMVECSCGQQRGIICIAITVDMYDPNFWTCRICGTEGVVALP